ncbi:serine/threonine protein kinase [Paenibacillus solani]|uniref:non-specific serine/threonine protein kinase n=1 Tax=Paenibacillus solani TaxID=1705565 RepID=A0A0M1P4H6_9BACL|nr:serine/threonine-protein kinase [Paenibacillus solani]KOR88939.1 serine/threonine protein kinase [Paenibacillus solani]
MNQPCRLVHGEVLGERYVIDRVIGEGGMSCVYLAEDLKLPGKMWAVKESLAEPGTQKAVQDEAQLLIKLSHPRLPRIVDYFHVQSTGYIYLVMDFIQGMNLEKYFRGFRGNVNPEFIMELTEQLLDVLEYLHNHEPQVIFRDLKPSNIMLTDQLEVRLIDFGIARSYKQESGEDTVKLGTVGFAAPEQYGGRQSDARSDLYGLGALLLYLSTNGKFSEWITGVERHIRGDLPRELVPVIRKLLQYAPEHRYQSAAEVRSALSRQQPVATNRAGSQPGKVAGTLVAAVLGASSGVGTTHSCIAFGHFLAANYGRVAVVEMSAKSTAFTRIQEIAEGGRLGAIRKFEVNGIHFWRQTARTEVISLLGGSYDAVVLDLGAYRDSDRIEEFLRADLPIVIGSGAEWRQHDVVTLARMLSRHPQPGRVYALPLAGEETIQEMKKLLGTNNVQSLPLQLDPFEVQDSSREAFSRLFQEYLPTVERKRRFRFRKS